MMPNDCWIRLAERWILSNAVTNERVLGLVPLKTTSLLYKSMDRQKTKADGRVTLLVAKPEAAVRDESEEEKGRG